MTLYSATRLIAAHLSICHPDLKWTNPAREHKTDIGLKRQLTWEESRQPRARYGCPMSATVGLSVCCAVNNCGQSIPPSDCVYGNRLYTASLLAFCQSDCHSLSARRSAAASHSKQHRKTLWKESVCSLLTIVQLNVRTWRLRSGGGVCSSGTARSATPQFTQQYTFHTDLWLENRLSVPAAAEQTRLCLPSTHTHSSPAVCKSHKSRHSLKCSVTTRADTRPARHSRMCVCEAKDKHLKKLWLCCRASWVIWFDGQTDGQTDRWPAITCQTDAMVIGRRWRVCETFDLLIYGSLVTSLFESTSLEERWKPEMQSVWDKSIHPALKHFFCVLSVSQAPPTTVHLEK